MAKNKSQNQDSILENLSQDSSNNMGDNPDNSPPAYDIDQSDINLLSQNEGLEETNSSTKDYSSTRTNFINLLRKGSIVFAILLVAGGLLLGASFYFYPQGLSSFISYFDRINVFSSPEHKEDPKEEPRAINQASLIPSDRLQELLSQESSNPDIQALQTEILMLIQRREELLARERQLQERITIIRTRITETDTSL